VKSKCRSSKNAENFSLVPVITGDVDPALMAQALAEHWDDKTLIVASTELSHYQTIRRGEALDTVTVNNIVQPRHRPDDSDRGPRAARRRVLALMASGKVERLEKPKLLGLS